MKNRYGKEYYFQKQGPNLYQFVMAEDDMKYMRLGGKDGQEGIDYNDLGMFDPSGGPYVAVGGQIYWDEIKDGTKSKPITVTKIMSKDDGLYVEVE